MQSICRLLLACLPKRLLAVVTMPIAAAALRSSGQMLFVPVPQVASCSEVCRHAAVACGSGWRVERRLTRFGGWNRIWAWWRGRCNPGGHLPVSGERDPSAHLNKPICAELEGRMVLWLTRTSFIWKETHTRARSACDLVGKGLRPPGRPQASCTASNGASAWGGSLLCVLKPFVQLLYHRGDGMMKMQRLGTAPRGGPGARTCGQTAACASVRWRLLHLIPSHRWHFLRSWRMFRPTCLSLGVHTSCLSSGKKISKAFPQFSRVFAGCTRSRPSRPGPELRAPSCLEGVKVHLHAEILLFIFPACPPLCCFKLAGSTVFCPPTVSWIRKGFCKEKMWYLKPG